MKKYLFAAAVLLSISFGSHVAFAQAAAAAATPAAATTNTAAGNGNFVPLTNIPAITTIAQSSGLISAFFNNLYLVAIGVAATLAVLQIMRAGIMWMGAGGSSEKITKARGLIGSSLFGLLLILSPTIVFGIINPSLLTLNLDFSNVKITPEPPSGAPAATPVTTPTTTTAIMDAAIAKGYSKFQWTVLPQGKECSDVPSLGAGWLTLDSGSCPTPSPTTNATCCGLSNTYQAPVSTPLPTAGSYSYTMVYENPTDGSCYSYSYSSPFKDLASCNTSQTNTVQAQKKEGPYAFVKMCSETSTHTPTPASSWSTLAALGKC